MTEWNGLTLREQHATFRVALQCCDWMEHIPFVVAPDDNKCGKLTFLEESGYYPLFEYGFYWFETTKECNLHIHMLVQCKNQEIAKEVSCRILRSLGIKNKTDIASDFRKVTDADGMLDYIYKTGEHKRKSYEVVDWNIFTPRWIHNRMSPETVELKKMYAEYCEELKARTEWCPTDEELRELCNSDNNMLVHMSVTPDPEHIKEAQACKF